MSRQQSIVTEHFDRAADYWNDIYEYTDVYSLIYQQRRAHVHDLVARLRLPLDSRVLEVGCGAGHTAIEIAKMGYCVEAIDSSGPMIDNALINARQAGVADRIRVRRADIRSLNVPPGSFQIVLAIGVLPWLDSLNLPLKSLADATAPGGNVITSVDHRWGWHRILDVRSNPLVLNLKTSLRRTFEAAGVRQPIARARTHSIGDLDQALSAAGLEKREGRTLGFGPFTFWNHHLLSVRREIAVHQSCQAHADAGHVLFRNWGAQYIVWAQKSISRRTS